MDFLTTQSHLQCHHEMGEAPGLGTTIYKVGPGNRQCSYCVSLEHAAAASQPCLLPREQAAVLAGCFRGPDVLRSPSQGKKRVAPPFVVTGVLSHSRSSSCTKMLVF